MIEVRNSPQRPVFWARPIWIHAASGEIEYAKSVMRELKTQYPEIPILITYFSPSALKLLQGVTEADFVLPLPFDQVSKVRFFLDYCNPLAVLFARTDVWPELAFQLNQRKVPTLLFSATLSTHSGRAQGIGKWLARFAFNQLNEIYCVNNEDLEVFIRLGVTSTVKVVGDTRFDQVQYRLRNPKKLKTELRPKPNLVFVAGSTWPQDEKVILPTLGPWIGAGGSVVIAPHEVTEAHLVELETNLQKLNLKSVRYSQGSKLSTDEILLVDQVGILPEIYTWGSVAFIGGSFKDRVHSVMEPLAAGLPVIVGPFHHNNREALHFNLQFIFEKLTMVTVAKDSEDLADSLNRIGAAVQSNPQISGLMKTAVNDHSGVSIKVAQWPPLVLMIKALQQPRA